MKKIKKSGTQTVEISIDDRISKYFWLIIPLLTALYYYYSTISIGFYQDDEIGQYINMLRFWKDPWLILGNNPKPGYKIFTVIPALFGYNYVLLFNSLIASVTVYFTYVLIRTYKVGNAAVGALLLASQPLWLELSFRSYSEVFTALCITIILILYRRDKFFFAALLCGYIFTIRQEIALLILILAYIFIRKKDYISAGALFIFPVIYNVLGFVKTGDVFFVLTEMKNVAALNYQSQGLSHYFKVYIFIVGPVSLTLFLLGFFGFFSDLKKYKEYLSSYLLFYVIFVSVFITQMLTMVNNGPNPGNWRYLLHISPLCAFFAAVGLNNLSKLEFRKTHLLITGSFAVLVLLFMSKATDGFALLDKPDYTKLIFVALLFVLILVLWNNSRKIFLDRLSAAAIILSVVYLFYTNEPKKLSPENISSKEIAEFVDNIQDSGSREKLVNHTMILFYAKSFKSSQDSFKKLDSENLKSAPKGSLIIWESHYGYRPEFHSDVKLETLQNGTSYKLVKQFVSTDKRFGSFVFEKL